MTEMVNVEGTAGGLSEPSLTSSGTPSYEAPVEQERTFRQSEVNDLIGRVKAEAVERYKRDSSRASHQSQPNAYQPVQQTSQYNGMSENEFRRLAAEEAQKIKSELASESQRNMEEQHANRIASEFFSKVSVDDGKESFEKILNDSGIDLRTIPYHVQLANMVENTKEVMVDLINNPVKLGAIQNLIDIDLRAGRQPNMALREMKRLSDAIKSNKNASSYVPPNDPLSQMHPSNAGTDNKGALTAADYRRKYKV